MRGEPGLPEARPRGGAARARAARPNGGLRGRPMARGLGRGLSALLGEADEADQAADGAAAVPAAAGGEGAREVPIELVHRNPEQPRVLFPAEELEELAASIREKGVLQPILVRPLDGRPGEYQI